MKTRIAAVLISLMLSGVLALAQEKPKSHQHEAPAKTEKSSEVSKPEAGTCCHGTQSASCCGSHETKAEATDNQEKKGSLEAAAVTYSCPMHPEVTSEKPGKCPKCAMDLIKKSRL